MRRGSEPHALHGAKTGSSDIGTIIAVAKGSLVMTEVARYSAIETLRDGRPVEIRALRPDDRTDFLAAVDRIGEQSRRRRFFGPRRFFSEAEIAYFLNVDFVDHVALVAVAKEDERPTIVGGGRYIVLQPGKAEIGFTVVDQYQRQGIGAALLRHLAMIGREVGLRELIAEVLTDNTAMLKVFEKSGFLLEREYSPGVVSIALRLV
jgi:RimJ/RimL family protein N-acetyltransferase